MAPDRVVLEVAGIRHVFRVAAYPAGAGQPGLVCVDSALGPVSLLPEPRFTDPAAQVERRLAARPDARYGGAARGRGR